jgi:hypothetical protein
VPGGIDEFISTLDNGTFGIRGTDDIIVGVNVHESYFDKLIPPQAIFSV